MFMVPLDSMKGYNCFIEEFQTDQRKSRFRCLQGSPRWKNQQGQ